MRRSARPWRRRADRATEVQDLSARWFQAWLDKRARRGAIIAYDAHVGAL